MLKSFAKTFAELRAEKTTNRPLYSIDNIGSPGLTNALLTEGL
jgi:hypothetical protein